MCLICVSLKILLFLKDTEIMVPYGVQVLVKKAFYFFRTESERQSLVLNYRVNGLYAKRVGWFATSPRRRFRSAS